MEVVPIAHSKLDWKSFNKIIKQECGYEPRHAFDSNDIDPEQHSSVVAALRDSLNPIDNLREPNETWEHVFFTLGCVLDADIIVELSSKTNLRFLTHERRRDYFTFCTGSVRDWYEACITFCTLDVHDDARLFINHCFTTMNKLGYRELFHKYDKTAHSDNTIILKER